jgi:hypothetical protein
MLQSPDSSFVIAAGFARSSELRITPAALRAKNRKVIL